MYVYYRFLNIKRSQLIRENYSFEFWMEFYFQFSFCWFLYKHADVL